MTEEKKLTLHMMDIETAMDFYKICAEMKIADDDVESKDRILLELSKHNDIRIWETKRPLKKFLEDLTKNYGKTLYVTKKQVDKDIKAFEKQKKKKKREEK